MKTPKAKRDKLALSEHKDIEAFQKWLRTAYQKDMMSYRNGKKARYSIDNVCVAGILYTMDEYDHNGQYITLTNKRNIDHERGQITIETSDRYSLRGYSDATVFYSRPFGLRNDINYLD